MLEVRQLTVLSQQATQRIPAHLPSGCTAVCCHIQTAGKAQAQVVLGGPHEGNLNMNPRGGVERGVVLQREFQEGREGQTISVRFRHRDCRHSSQGQVVHGVCHEGTLNMHPRERCGGRR